MKKLLILGGTGFLGANVFENLEHLNKYSIYLPTSRELNLLDENSVDEYLGKHRFDVVFDFAVYGDAIDKTKEAGKILEYNLRMFLNLQKNSHLFGKLYFTGSGAEYDKRYPIEEITEDQYGQKIPVDQYGLMKYTVNQIIEKSSNIYNLRLFGIFGKYEYWPTKFISNICCKAIKGLPITIRQNVYFDYLWIEDFCKIIEWFINHEPKCHSYNVVSGKRIDLYTLAKKVVQISGKDLPIYVCKEGFANEYTAGNQRLLDEIGNFQYTSLDESIKCLYQWYEERQDNIDIYSLLYQ